MSKGQAKVSANPRLILEHKRCKFYIVYLSKFNFPSNLFTRFDETAITKPTRNTRKIANKLMTAASGKINLQKSKHDRTHIAKAKAAFHSWRNKHDVIQHASQEKVATSTHSMNYVIPFYVFNTRFKSSASITQKGNIFSTK